MNGDDRDATSTVGTTGKSQRNTIFEPKGKKNYLELLQMRELYVNIYLYKDIYRLGWMDVTIEYTSNNTVCPWSFPNC